MNAQLSTEQPRPSSHWSAQKAYSVLRCYWPDAIPPLTKQPRATRLDPEAQLLSYFFSCKRKEVTAWLRKLDLNQRRIIRKYTGARI